MNDTQINLRGLKIAYSDSEGLPVAYLFHKRILQRSLKNFLPDKGFSLYFDEQANTILSEQHQRGLKKELGGAGRRFERSGFSWEKEGKVESIRERQRQRKRKQEREREKEGQIDGRSVSCRRMSLKRRSRRSGKSCRGRNVVNMSSESKNQIMYHGGQAISSWHIERSCFGG